MTPFRRTGMLRKRLSSGKRAWVMVVSPRLYSTALGEPARSLRPARLPCGSPEEVQPAGAERRREGSAPGARTSSSDDKSASARRIRASSACSAKIRKDLPDHAPASPAHGSRQAPTDTRHAQRDQVARVATIASASAPDRICSWLPVI